MPRRHYQLSKVYDAVSWCLSTTHCTDKKTKCERAYLLKMLLEEANRNYYNANYRHPVAPAFRELPDRTMRKAIMQGIIAGRVPMVLSAGDGYYVTADPAMIQLSIDYTEKRIETLCIKKAALIKAHYNALQNMEGYGRQEKMFADEIKS